MVRRTKKSMTHEERFIERVYNLHLRNPAKHTPGQAVSNADQNPDHLSGQARVRGNLAPGRHLYTFDGDKLKQAFVQSYYAWNAWNYLGSGADGSRDVYKGTRFPEHQFFHADHRPNFYQLYPTQALGTYADAQARYRQEKDPDLRRYYRRKTSILYVSKELNLRTSFIGVTLPYPWEAHHLLSTNVFYKNLTLEQIKVILRSDYDLNDGRNIIFLPQEPIDTPVHKLPYHASGHSKYDDKVNEEMTQLKSLLDDIVKNQRDHKEAAKKVEDELHKVEKVMFKYTCSLGKKPRQKLS